MSEEFNASAQANSDLVEVSSDSMPVHSDHDEIRRRLQQAITGYREMKEIHDKMVEDGEKTEQLKDELEAENMSYKNTLTELQRQREMRKQKWEEENEEALRQQILAEEENSRMTLLIRDMEADNRDMRRLIEDLWAELENRSSEYEDEKQEVWTAVDELEFKSELLLRQKDKEIQQKSRTQTENMKIIEDLRKEHRQLRKHLSDMDEQQTISPLTFLKKTSTETQDASAVDKYERPQKTEDTERPQKTEDTERSWWRSGAKILWTAAKALTRIACGAVLSVGVFYNCTHPDCDPWNVVFELLDAYFEHTFTVPPVY